VYIETNRSR